MFLSNMYSDMVEKYSTKELVSALSVSLKNIRADMKEDIKSGNMNELCLNVGKLDNVISVISRLDDRLNSKNKQKVL